MSAANSRSLVPGILVGLGIAILLAVTNPSEQAHREAMAREFAQARPLAGAVGLGALGAQLPVYHSAVFGSYLTSDGEIRSIGVVGMVWVIDSGAG